MKLENWVRYLVAAVLVILFGAAWALAEEKKTKVEVRSTNGQEISIDVNGVTKIVTLDDLADGEEKTFEVGGHEVTVKRDGDRLSLDHEGMMATHLLGGEHREVWVGSDDENVADRRVVVVEVGDEGASNIDLDSDLMFIGEGHHGAHDVLILKDEDGEIDVEALKEKFGENFEEFDTDDGAHVFRWVMEGDRDHHPFIVKKIGDVGGEYVTYRCEETGSMLRVKADENLLDDYVDPVTGCVMKKVEHSGVHVITIREDIVSEDSDE
jgi:hypothetical protein